MHLCQNKRRLRVFYHIVDSIFWVGWIYRDIGKKDYPREKTIHRVFEEKAKNTPNAIAVVYKDKHENCC
jgi:hypothetical protein